MSRACPFLKGLFFSWLFILATSASGKADFTHVVGPGESLYSIAKKYDLTVKAIQEANGLQDTRIRLGRNLAIPGDGAKARAHSQGKKVAQQESEEQEFTDWDIPETHVVKKGETLEKIAQRYHLAVEDLQAANALKGGRKLKPGQTIYLLPPLEAEQQERPEVGKESQGNQPEANTQLASAVAPVEDGRGEEKDRRLLAKVAKAFLGLKYIRLGTSINGMDCSAFVQKIFRIFDVDLPRTTREQFQVGYAVAREALAIGDLVFFKRGQARRPGHVGIYIGEGQFIHTSLRNQRVQVNSLESRYFAARFIGAKRVGETRNGPEEPGRN